MKNSPALTSHFNPAHWEPLCMWCVWCVSNKMRIIWTKCFLLILDHQKDLWWGALCHWCCANVSLKDTQPRAAWEWEGRRKARGRRGFGTKIIILRLSSLPSTSEGKTKTEKPQPHFPPEKDKEMSKAPYIISIMWQHHRERQVIEKAIFRQQLYLINDYQAFLFVAQTHRWRHKETHCDHAHTHTPLHTQRYLL